MAINETINRVLEIAKAETGYLEKNKGQDLYSKTPGGDDNYTKYWADIYPSYQKQPWCLCFCLWVFYKAFGLEMAKKMLYMKGITFYTPTSADYFKANKAWSPTPKAGDLIFFKNSTRIYHVGIVANVDSTRVYTIEGNTSGGAAVEANGGGVFQKSYPLNLSKIAGYGRPNWSLAGSDNNKAKELTTYNVSTGIKGLKIIAIGGLNVRDYPATGNKISTLANGSYVKPDKKTFINNKPWYHIPNGWISASYVEGWVKEDNGKWWYVKSGYDCTKNGSQQIDGQTYYFDKEGYMRQDELVKETKGYWYIKSDGLYAKAEWIEKDSTWYYAKPDGWLAQNEFLSIHSEKYGNELYRFNNDCTLFKGSMHLSTNNRGALV